MRSVFRISVFLAAFSVVVAGIPKASQAVIVLGEFEGVVTVASGSGGAAVPGGITPGDPVDGRFRWDTDTAFGTPVNPNRTDYTFLPQPNNLLDILIKGLTWFSGTEFNVSVTNDDPVLGDALVLLSGLDPIVFPGALGLGNNFSTFFGGDPLVSDLFASLALPPSLNAAALSGLDPLSSLVGQISTFDPNDPFTNWLIVFVVDPDSVSFESFDLKTRVFEPATFGLFGFGLVGCIAARSRVRNKRRHLA